MKRFYDSILKNILLLAMIVMLVFCTNVAAYAIDDIKANESTKTTDTIIENDSLSEEKIINKPDITKDITTIKETTIKIKQKANDAIIQEIEKKEAESLNEEKTVKITQVPILVDDKGNEVIYIAGLNKLETVQRSLKIRDRIIVNLYKAKHNKEEISIEYTKVNDELVFYINKNETFRLNELDLQVNNLEKPELLTDIKKCLNNYSDLLGKEDNIQLVEKHLTDLDDVIYFSLFTIFLFIIIEFMRKKLNKFIDRKTHKHFQKSLKPINEGQLDSSDTDELEKKEALIKLIAKQLNFIANFSIFTFELVTLFVYISYLLYFNLQTHHFARFVIHSIESYSIIARDYFTHLFSSEVFWGSVGYISFIFVFMILAIVLISQLSQLATNIITVSSDIEHSKNKRHQTLNKMITAIAYIVIVFLAIVFALMHLGHEITPILAGAGIAGLAISFGAQNLIKDIINGVFIIFENQFGIGDTVKINGESGKVEDMSLRITILRNFMSGKVSIIPNGSIQTVEVYTKEWAKANITVSIAYKEDIDTAIRIIKETADKIRMDYPVKIINDPRILGVVDLNDSSIDIKLIIETLAGKQWEIEREFRRRIKYAFDANNIEIPFPHRTLYLRHDDLENPEQLTD